MNLIWLYLIGYLLILLLVSVWVSRKQSAEDFLVASRNRGVWQVLASVFATTIGAGFFLTYTGFAYEYGLGVFAILAGFILGYLVYALWAAPRIRGKGKGKHYTIGHYVLEKTSSHAARVLTDILASLVMLFWLVVGVIGGAKIVSEFGLLSYNLAIILFAIVVLAYVLLAGYRAVLLTDLIQGIVLLVLLVMVTIGIAGANIGEVFGAASFSIDWFSAIGFLIFGIFGRFSRGDLFQLVYASKDTSVAKRSFLYSTLPVILTCFLLLVIGVFMALQVSGLDSALVFTAALQQYLPVWLVPLAIVMFFAGVMSSADTNIYGIASHFAHYRKNALVGATRVLAFAVVLIVSLFALYFPDIVDMSILAGGINLVLPAAVIYVLAGGRSGRKVVSSIALGIVGLVVGIVLLGLVPSIAVFPLIFGGLGLLYPKKA